MSLPAEFCWTRFGTEASQSVAQILERKERERIAGSGTFFWGIGNAIGPSMRRLLERNTDPEVLFSPIKGRPRDVDAKPSAVAVWTQAMDLFERSFTIPSHACIISRFDVSNAKSYHYALVCYSEGSLAFAGSDLLYVHSLSNLLTGRSVGASQVTAVVNRREAHDIRGAYQVAARVKLAPPYLIKLSNPKVLTVTA